jgi:hypothetical protein
LVTMASPVLNPSTHQSINSYPNTGSVIDILWDFINCHHIICKLA